MKSWGKYEIPAFTHARIDDVPLHADHRRLFMLSSNTAVLDAVTIWHPGNLSTFIPLDSFPISGWSQDAGVGRGYGVGRGLGVTLCLGVADGVAVGVSVAVGLGVGVGVDVEMSSQVSLKYTFSLT